jgi:hypothetical protein
VNEINRAEPEDRGLLDALRAVAEDDAGLNASPAVEAHLLREVRAIGRTRWSRSRMVQLAVAAALLAAIALPAWFASTRSSVVIDSPAPDERLALAMREETTDFFPLAYSNVPAPGGYIVRMQVPRTVLDSFGVAGFSAPADGATTVAADVVVGGDGLARAVRFVRVVPQ